MASIAARDATAPPIPAYLTLALELCGAAAALLIAAYFSFSTHAAVIDPDIWWHIRVGDWIGEHRTLPHSGVFTRHGEQPWVAYSWGFELFASAVHRLWGMPGIIGALIIFQIVLSLVFLMAMRRLAGSRWPALAIAAASIYAFYVNPLRPMQFSLLFFTIELLVIFDAERRRNSRLLLWMGPLFLVWANVHIQFVYGIAVLGIYVATRTWESAHARRDLVGPASLALALAASCVGPNGWLPYRVAFSYATQPAQYQIIQEMAALSFRHPEHYVQLLLVMSACFALGRSRSSDLFRPMLLLVTAVVAFRSTRDSWFVSMAAGFVLAEAVGRARQGETADEPLMIRPAVLYTLAALVAAGISFQLVHPSLSIPAISATVDRVYPLRAAEFVEASNLQGPMYNDFNWGGFLIYRLPGHPVSIDPRVDLHGDERLARSLRTANAAPGWQDDPDLASAGFVVIQRWFPLATALGSDPNFRRVYDDHLASVFVRVTPDRSPR